jgi:hypothetical protein
MPYRLFLELGMCYTFCIKRVHNRIKKATDGEQEVCPESVMECRKFQDVGVMRRKKEKGWNICWHSLKKFIKFLLQEYQIEGLGNVFQHTISR